MNVLFIIISSFLLSWILFRKAAGTLDIGKINIVSYVYYLFLIQTFIGISLIKLGFDEHYTLNYLINREKSINTTFFVVMLVAIIFPIIIILVQKILRVNMSQEYITYLSTKPEKSKNDFYYKIISIASIVLIILLVGYLIKIGYVPFLKLLTASGDFDFAHERIRIGTIYFLHPYITNLLILQGIPLLSYLSFSFALIERDKKWYVLTGILFIASVITKTYKFSKAPLPFHLFVYVLICIYMCGGIKRKIMLLIAAVMAVMLWGMYTLIGATSSLLDIYNGIWGRTLFTQVGTLSYVFDLFPNHMPFLQGRSLAGNILKLLGENPNEHLRSAKLVMDFYGSERVYDGTAGVMNSFFIGEAYANWGWSGIICSIFLVGIIIAVLSVIIVKMKKNAISIAFCAVITTKIGNTTQGGFCDFIYNVDLYMTIFIFLALYYGPDIYEKIKKIKVGKKNET